MNRWAKRALVAAGLVATVALGHQVHTYGMPWDGPVQQPVGCIQPASDGPVRYWDGKQWQSGWPQVCHQWNTGSANGGVYLELFGHQVGYEVYGTPGPFIQSEG